MKTVVNQTVANTFIFAISSNANYFLLSLRLPSFFSALLYQLLLLLLLLFYSFTAGAQLCTGSLGDPIVNITFGAGSGYAQALPSTITDYSFKSTDCPDDGFYSLVNKTGSCFGNTWHTLNQDHTADGNGYFMLINASYTPGDFYKQTISGLCANTTYEFAAWLMNVLRNSNGIMPNITFSIETGNGTILKSYNTDDIPATTTPEWKQYGFFFKTPPDVSEIVLKITNNAPGGIGNDLALDDITFRPCGPNLTTSTSNGIDTIHMCAESSYPVTLTADIATGFDDPVFFWQVSRDSGKIWQDVTGATTNTLVWQPTSPGTYWYRYSAAEKQNSSRQACRVASKAIVINLYPTPVANAGPDKSVLKGFESRLGSSAQNGVVYNWSPALYMDSANSARPRIRPQDSANYTLTATSVRGCTSTDAVAVQVIDQLYIPNAFTPNGDGHNDAWRIPHLDPDMGAAVRVFNRFGQLVYQNTGSLVNWNGMYQGKPHPGGTLVYFITFKGELMQIKGTLHLLR
jgi:gliding motility-associated-like protein